jgi:putative hydrolase
MDLNNPNNVGILRPVEWIEQTTDVWVKFVTPIAKSTMETMRERIKQQSEEFKEFENDDDDPNSDIGAILGFNIGGKQANLELGKNANFEEIILSVGKASFSAQIGAAIADLSRVATYGSEFGIPLFQSKAVLLPYGVSEFAKEVDINKIEVEQYLALREVAGIRLFQAFPWLGSHLISLISSYSENIHFNFENLAEEVGEMLLENPNEMLGNLQSQDFAFKPTDDQKKQIAKMELILGLIDGWIDYVTFRSGLVDLSNIVKMKEYVSRYRLSGESYGKAFQNLIGITLHPTKAREASILWEKLYQEKGNVEAEKVWRHIDSVDSFIKENNHIFKVKKGDLDDLEIKHDWDSLLS